MSPTDPFAAADLPAPGDLVNYHGSLTDLHGVFVVLPCPCRICERLDRIGSTETRYMLIDPWGDLPGPHHVRRQSITRSTANG